MTSISDGAPQLHEDAPTPPMIVASEPLIGVSAEVAVVFPLT
jgi:hypothetical protein